MSKLFKRKPSFDGSSHPNKLTPLTVPGVVERGQCLRCSEDAASGENLATTAKSGSRSSAAISVPTVKGVPVLLSSSAAAACEIKDDVGNLKQPPETFAESGLSSVLASTSSQQSSSECDESESGDCSDDESIDPLEEFPLLDLNLCPVEYDHASSSLVNNLKRWGTEENEIDDRKPAAKPVPIKKGNAREIGAIDPEVFSQLPPEMQKEVMEQQQRAGSESFSSSINGQSNNDAGKACTVHGTPIMTEDIDPETLASLPDNIRKEVLEQARRKQQVSTNDASAITGKASFPRSTRNKLSQSTTAYLDGCNIDLDDFQDFPKEVQDDIMEQRRRDNQFKETNPLQENTDLDLSEYDPETLASLPENVRKEVLDEERRNREKRHRNKGKKQVVVGAHSVNVPAGYDPETFEALPKDVQQDLIDDARQAQQQGLRYSAEGYDYSGIADARVVQAQSACGMSASCTYTGEYNIMGKRHGDGELKWANGDLYVGKFKMGFIEGRGTINFHDGTEYTGQWKGNRFHGEGTRRFKNGNVYTGNYAAGKRHGQGRCYFANGDLYVGDWKDDTIHGFGRYYYNNGHSFEGMFRNGKRNGRGKYQLTDGRVEIYRYVNDSRVGDGVRWSKCRKKAWRMNDGKVTKRVSIEEAAAIAKRCGPLVEES